MKNEWLNNIRRRRSLEMFAKMGGTLDLYYDYQFVQNENTPTHKGEEIRSSLTLEHGQVCKGTMVGTVYIGKTPVQIFHVTSGGEFVFQKIGTPMNFVCEAGLDLNEGKVFLRFREPPGEHLLVVNYEYSLECYFDPNQ